MNAPVTLQDLKGVVEAVRLLPAGSERREKVYAALELALFELLPQMRDRLEAMLGSESEHSALRASGMVGRLLQWLRHERETDAKLKQMVGEEEKFEVTVRLKRQTLEGIEAARLKRLGDGVKEIVVEGESEEPARRFEVETLAED